MNETIENMTNPNSLTLEFHETYGQPVRSEPVYDVPEIHMRASLILEEVEELLEAVEKGEAGLVDVADALGDLVYVCYGAAHTHGLKLDPSFDITDKETPARALLRMFIQDGQNPSPKPSLNHPDIANAVRSLHAAATEYVLYVTETATEHGDVAAILDYLIFIVSGSYYTSFILGIPLDAVLQEIQKSNMSKLGEDGKPIYREDGKVLKGPNFFIPEPNIEKVLIKAGWVKPADVEEETVEIEAETILEDVTDETTEQEAPHDDFSPEKDVAAEEEEVFDVELTEEETLETSDNVEESETLENIEDETLKVEEALTVVSVNETLEKDIQDEAVEEDSIAETEPTSTVEITEDVPVSADITEEVNTAGEEQQDTLIEDEVTVEEVVIENDPKPEQVRSQRPQTVEEEEPDFDALFKRK